MTTSTRALSFGAFSTLLLIALMMGGNHVAARVAFNHGVDVATAVVFRSAVTAVVVTALVLLQAVPIAFTARHRRFLLLFPSNKLISHLRCKRRDHKTDGL